MYCKFCGKEIADDAVYCKYCGNKRVLHSVAPPTRINENASLVRTNPSRKKRKVPIFLALLFIVAAALLIWNYYIAKQPTKKTPYEMSKADFVWNETPSDIVLRQQEQVNSYIESMKEEESDIEGWSAFDKYEYGLDLEDGSDTDNDGLTDKEEIEKYGSDPLKCSTSNDLYTDGYKVQNGMDIFTPVEYENDEQITDETGGITLYIKTPRDFTAKIVDVTNEYLGEDSYLLAKLPDQFYFAYKVCSYDSDTISIDLGVFADELGVDAGCLDVETVALQGNKYSKTRMGDIVSVIYENVQPFDSGVGEKSYNIFIVNKEESESIQSALFNRIMGREKRQDTDVLEGMICISPSKTAVFQRRVGRLTIPDPTIRSVKGGGMCIICSYGASPEEKETLIRAAEFMYESLFAGEKITITEDEINFRSQRETESYINAVKEELDDGIGVDLGASFDGEYPSMIYGGYTWFSDDFMNNESVEEYKVIKQAKIEDKEKRFVIKDEFRFENPTSDLFADVVNNNPVDHGVCAGMAQIVAEVYNSDDNCIRRPKDEVDFQTNYNDSVITKTESYDITNKEGMSTFFDRYLNDFSLNNEEDKNDFMKLVSCYWARANINMHSSIDYRSDLLLNSIDGNFLDWETINRAIEYLDNFQILLFTCCIGNTADGEHCVNLVSYKRGTAIGDDGKECETVTFDVYDSNYPGGYLKLLCYKVETSDGRNTVFYKYNPCCEGDPFGYYASFVGDRYEYNPQNEDLIPKRCEFGIFNDQGQCLNVKL